MMRDKAKLMPKKIRDKNGKATTVWVAVSQVKSGKKPKGTQGMLTKLSGEEVAAADVVIKSAFDTNGKNFGKDLKTIYTEGGKLNSERAKLHDSIVARHFKGLNPKKKGEPIVSMMMGGAPASGKSSIVDGGFLNEPKGLVYIDADKAKRMLPEYIVMEDRKNGEGANFAHK